MIRAEPPCSIADKIKRTLKAKEKTAGRVKPSTEASRARGHVTRGTARLQEREKAQPEP